MRNMPRTLMATKVSSKNATVKTLITVNVLFALMLSCFPLLEVKGQNYPTVYWSPSTVSVTLQQGSTQPVKASVFGPPAPPPGDVQSKIVSFYSTTALKNATLVIDPKIEPFLRNAYPQPGTLAAWQGKNIFLFFSIPAGTRVGNYEGTIQVRNGNQLLPGGMKVVIRVLSSDTQFSLFSNPGDPLLLRAKKPNGDIVEYFGTKSANGLATALTSVTVRSANGDTTKISLDELGRPTRIVAANGTVFKVAWQSSSKILLTAISPEGSVQVNVSIDLTQVPDAAACPSCASASLMQSSPTARTSTRRITRLGGIFEALVASKPLEMFKPSAVALNTNTSIVNVSRCGSPVNDADVGMTVIPSQNALDAYNLPGTLTGSGQYSVTFPTQPSPGQPAENLCKTAAEWLGKGCDALQALPQGSEAFICAQLSLAISAIGTPAAGAAILAACSGAFLAARIYCATLGWSPVPGAPNLGEVLCSKVSEVVDRFTGGDLFIFPIVLIPGHGVVDNDTGQGQNVPSSGPFPTFDVDAGGSVNIASFTTTPADPAPFQSYIAEALVECVPPGTIVTISISGTDGYFDSTSVTISGDANIQLSVPGAEESVVDTITVQIGGGPSRTIVLVF